MNAGPPLLFDHLTVLHHRRRAAGTPGDAFLLEEVSGGLAERLAAVNRRFERGVDIEGRARLGATAGSWITVALAENGALPVGHESFDLAVSALALHAVNDLPGVLAQVRRALKPDGLFLAALFGGETLFELRDSFASAEVETTGGISPRVAPFADVRDLGGLLQRAGFALPVADVERTTVLYRDFTDLVRDLRLHGETNALSQRSRRPLSRKTLAAMLAHYQSHHAEPDGRLRATFDIVYLTGWAPHESQQTPLRPGSATARLADALGATEHKVRRD
jgi:SAM-dependent methyltransferase